MRTPPTPRTATAGRSCSASACAGTSPRTSASPHAWRATTTSTDRTAPGRADARRHRPRSAGSSPKRRSRAATRSRSGGTASRRAASPMSRTVSKARCGSWPARSSRPSTWAQRARHDQRARRHRRGARRDRGHAAVPADAPVGVRGRNSDNTMIRETLGWEPSVTLRSGLERTYRWVFDQVSAGQRRSTLPRR